MSGHGTSGGGEPRLNDAKLFFDDAASDYDIDPFHDAVARLLVSRLEPGSGAFIADVACGTGFAAFAALMHAPRRVIAVDLSPSMIQVARTKSVTADPEGSIEWMSTHALPLPVRAGELDAVVCASSVHFLGEAALDDWRRALRAGGRVAFSVPSVDSFRPSPAAARLVAPGFDIPSTRREAGDIAAAHGFEDVAVEEVRVPSSPRTAFAVWATVPD